jgi:hypothetical protein
MTFTSKHILSMRESSEKGHTFWWWAPKWSLIEHKACNSFDHPSHVLVHGCKYCQVVLIVSEVMELCLMVSHGLCPIWCLYPTIWWNSYDFGLIHYLTWLYHCGQTTAWSMDFLRPFVVFSVSENVRCLISTSTHWSFLSRTECLKMWNVICIDLSVCVSLVRWTSPK